MTDIKKVIVLGAGVVGLTTAVKIQERGQCDVTIIAEVLPDDPKTIKYTSHWAGAHHIVNVTDEKQQKMELDTFEVEWELSKPGSATEEYFLRITETEFYCDPNFRPPLNLLPDHRVLLQDTLPPGVAHGHKFSTVSIDTPRYLHYLASRFTESGGRILRGTVHHIQQVIEGGESLFAECAPVPPDAVVVCTGLGTRFLGGVEDKDIYPIRGQTILIRAPWIKFGIARIEADETLTYVIPRRSGNIILGGTMDVGDWFPHPRPETTRQILERSFGLCPELAPPEIRELREPTVDDILPLVIEEGCGFRPARKGGIRLEVEWLEAPAGGREVPVVFNYGHGGSGFQSSWGSANIALALLEEALDIVAS